MVRFLKDLILLIVLLIVLPIGILVLLSWWQRHRDEYTVTMMDRAVDRTVKPTSIEIPLAMLASTAPDEDVPALKEPAKKMAPDSAAEDVKVKITPVAGSSSRLDDLRRIEGIGPKIAGLLQKVGITTFVQLAQTDTARLKEILETENLPFINPETWPDQAALAAREDWDGLDKFQIALKGGRRA